MITAQMVKELRERSGAGMMDCKNALAESNGDMDTAMEWLREKGIAKVAKKESRIAAEGLARVFIEGNKAAIIEINSETDFVSKNEEFTGMIDTIGVAVLKTSATTVEEIMDENDGALRTLITEKTSLIGEKLSFRRFEVLEKTDDESFGSYLHLGGRIAVLTKIKGANETVAKDVSMQAAAMRPQYVFVSDIPADVVEKERKFLKEQVMEEGKSEDIAVKMVEGRLNKFYKEVCLTKQAFVKDSGIDVETYVKNNNGEIINVVRYEVGEGIEKKVEDFAAEVMNQVNKA